MRDRWDVFYTGLLVGALFGGLVAWAIVGGN